MHVHRVLLIGIWIVSVARTQTFTFSAPATRLHEVGIVMVNGGFRVGKAKDTKTHDYVAAVDSNREQLATETLEKMGVPMELWGEAVGSRPLMIVGRDGDPFEISVCTMRDAGAMTRLFGDDLKTTYAYEFKLGRMGDAKSRSIDDQMVEVEVGAVGDGTYRLERGFQELCRYYPI